MGSTGVLALEQLPKTMIVIGAGVIGLEVACAYAAFGTKITVIEALDHVLSMLDADITADCVQGYAQLAHTASRMGEISAENIMGLNTTYDESTNPTCVYMEPEAAAVGFREDQLETGTYEVGTFPMMANGKALITNGGEGLIKIIADKETEKIVGMHMIGPRAMDLIAEGAVAVRVGMKVDELIETIHLHPTISEAVREAALSLQGRTLNMPPAK
ncbi:FAD-dependent oxidoreductase [Pseudoramibacter sp. HA2172]|uniref:FAD-dependent oxidoreductase n=1 Tax=Pseudoramibacter faecis TaxID=3108534 RepID=UPI002E79187F|nr:FAD-dependent oxidoreductase [Pseudoramibacter sp. HA2172]